MRCFVTGASGFVGRHLVPLLLEAGPVWALQRDDGVGPLPAGCTAVPGDVTSAQDLGSVPPVDVIVHLAAEASPQRASQRPDRARRTNVEGTRNVIDLARRRRARLVFLSTGQVYGPGGGRPLREDDPLRPGNVYAQTKAEAEGSVAQAGREGLSATTLRCFNMYGPGQTGPYVVPDIMAALRQGQTPLLRDLAPARDFLYIGDAARAIALVAGRPDAPPVLNVASGTTVTIGEVAAIACRLAGVPAPVGPRGRPDEVQVDVARMRGLGWSPQAGLEEGLRRTLDWWRALP